MPVMTQLCLHKKRENKYGVSQFALSYGVYLRSIAFVYFFKNEHTLSWYWIHRAFDFVISSVIKVLAFPLASFSKLTHILLKLELLQLPNIFLYVISGHLVAFCI